MYGVRNAVCVTRTHALASDEGSSPDHERGKQGRTRSDSLLTVTMFLALVIAVSVVFLPLYNYTFREPLPEGWGWQGNDLQLLLFGWQVWGGYINLGLAIVISVMLHRYSGNESAKQVSSLAVVLSMVMIIVSFSSLFSVYAMVLPPPTIPTIRDDEPFITVLAPKATGVLFLIASLIRLVPSVINSD